MHHPDLVGIAEVLQNCHRRSAGLLLRELRMVSVVGGAAQMRPFFQPFFDTHLRSKTGAEGGLQ
jgi:hypothetical protein